MTSRQFYPFPPSAPFVESTRSTGINSALPDFPGGAGDRELGKFRPSATPRLVQVAVVGDDGKQIGTALVPSMDEQTLLLKAMVLGLSLLTNTDLINEVSE